VVSRWKWNNRKDEPGEWNARAGLVVQGR
jgi:hypothetical protein